MKRINIKSIRIENFKGIRELSLEFGSKTKIKGQNASGKSTIFDAVCWILFDKNGAGESKFEIRPLGPDGNRIDNIEIKVVATLVVDGAEVELSKTQKQKWVKKRGSATAELQGNENLFEVDGYPKGESEYKAFISGLVDENLFKMITNPQYFSAMKWKDQRNILMRFATDLTDAQLARQINEEEFALLIPELEKAPSTDDIGKKYGKALAEWKKKQAEIPVRIDELSKSIVDVDVAELELAKKDLERKMNAAASGSNDELSELMSEEMKLQFEMSGIMQDMNRKLSDKRRQIEAQVSDMTIRSSKLRTDVETAKHDHQKNLEAITESQKKRKSLGDDYRAWKNKEFVPDDSIVYREDDWHFDESRTICKSCGQPLPADRIGEIKANFENLKEKAREESAAKIKVAMEAFEKSKAENIKRIIDEGNDLKKHESEVILRNEEMETSILDREEKLRTMDDDLRRLTDDLNSIPKEADYAQDDNYVRYANRRTEVLARIEELKAMAKEANDNSETAKDELRRINDELSRAARNAEIQDRIAELKEEQRDVAQKVADQEQMIYLLESFIRAKMDRISSDINKHFKTVNFKLFRMLLNGGIEECCECTVNGVPYSALNSGHRIIAGMDIIKSLSELYGIETFIFTDNAESLNEYNVPDMDAQMILLSVSDDKNLKVEVA